MSRNAHVHQGDDTSFLPTHAPTTVSGFHAYSNQVSVQPGDHFDLRISGSGPVESRILKLGASCADGKQVAILPTTTAHMQAIHIGSYVHIENGLDPLNEFSIELWFRTLSAGQPCGLIGQQCCQLGLTETNAPVISLQTAAGRVHVHGADLPLKEWHHLVACVDHKSNGSGSEVALFVDGERCGLPITFPDTLVWNRGVLRIAALENDLGQACGFFTGDIWAPSVYAHKLNESVIRRRYQTKCGDMEAACVSQWRFDAVDGIPGRDVLGVRPGRLINFPTRMIPGPRSQGDADWRTYDPLADADFGHAIRFMSDQCADSRWPVACSWQVPLDISSGQYATKLTNSVGEIRLVYFIVRPTAPRARIMCLSTTSTRVAYNFTSFNNSRIDCGAYLNHPSYPVLGHLISSRRPASGSSGDSDWLKTTVDFELPFYQWLEREGIAFDLYSEWDLVADPTLIDSYEVIAWAGHSEYWTHHQYEAVQRFIARGGHVLSMSGNTAFWRVSVDLKSGVMECRKHERKAVPGTNCDPMLDNAHWHQMDHLPGTNLRFAGWPEWGLLGSVSSGFSDPPLNGPRRAYEVLVANHAIFHNPRIINTDGAFAPDAAGYEIDMTCRTMCERFGPPRTPGHSPWNPNVPAMPDGNWDLGMTILARAKIPNSDLLDIDNVFAKNGGDMLAEMTIWERPGLGTIFTAGSVMSSQVLLTDDNFSACIRNVLDRFLTPTEISLQQMRINSLIQEVSR